MNATQVKTVTDLVLLLLSSGASITAEVETLVKQLIGVFSGGSLTDAQIADGWAAVLADDQVIAATAKAESGQ